MYPIERTTFSNGELKNAMRIVCINMSVQNTALYQTSPPVESSLSRQFYFVVHVDYASK